MDFHRNLHDALSRLGFSKPTRSRHPTCIRNRGFCVDQLQFSESRYGDSVTITAAVWIPEFEKSTARTESISANKLNFLKLYGFAGDKGFVGIHAKQWKLTAVSDAVGAREIGSAIEKGLNPWFCSMKSREGVVAMMWHNLNAGRHLETELLKSSRLLPKQKPFPMAIEKLPLYVGSSKFDFYGMRDLVGEPLTRFLSDHGFAASSLRVDGRWSRKIVERNYRLYKRTNPNGVKNYVLISSHYGQCCDVLLFAATRRASFDNAECAAYLQPSKTLRNLDGGYHSWPVRTKDEVSSFQKECVVALKGWGCLFFERYATEDQILERYR